MARTDLQLRSSRTIDDGGCGKECVLEGRDLDAFFQAETHMLTFETQMLRHEVRELGESSAMLLPMSVPGPLLKLT